MCCVVWFGLVFLCLRRTHITLQSQPPKMEFNGGLHSIQIEREFLRLKLQIPQTEKLQFDYVYLTIIVSLNNLIIFALVERLSNFFCVFIHFIYFASAVGALVWR